MDLSDRKKLLIHDLLEKKISVQEFHTEFNALFVKPSDRITKDLLEIYISLIHDYLEEKISVQEFTTEFNDLFLRRSDRMSHKLYLVLDSLFSTVEAYSPLNTKEDEDKYNVLEPTVREKAEKIYEALLELKKYYSESSSKDDD
jgi:hypothetical protein